MLTLSRIGVKYGDSMQRLTALLERVVFRKIADE